MVLEVSIESIGPEPSTVVAEPDEVQNHSHRPDHDLFTVHVNSTRILTISTAENTIAGKWLTYVLKSTASNFKPLNPNPDFRPDAFFVGLTVDTDGGTEDKPYVQLLTFCVGSHCLMLQIFEPANYPTPKVVKAFFNNPRVVVFGRDMANVAKKLKKLNLIEIRNAVDLNELAIRGMKRDDLDLGRYDLDRLAITVLGKEYDVIRPERRLDWWRDIIDYIADTWRLCKDKVKMSTVDTYLCWLIGTALVAAIHGVTEKKKKKKEKKKNAAKRRQ